MKKIIFVFLMLVLIMSVNLKTGEKNIEQDIKKFKIEIIKYYFGRENIYITITPDEIICETAKKLNRKNYSIFKREMTEGEKADLINFLADFPINDLKDNYYNKGVKDGTQLGFIIKIDDIEKNINVANYYIVELGELVDEVIKLLPEDHINYNRETVPEVIGK